MRRWFTNFLFRYKTAVWVSWTVVVFLLHAFPGEYLPAVSWADWIAFDKWIHALMFASGVYVFRFSRAHRGVLFFGLMCFAFSLELFQLTVASGRSFDWVDLIADAIGIALGLAVF